MKNESFRDATLEELLQVNGGGFSSGHSSDVSIVIDDDTTQVVPVGGNSGNGGSTHNSDTPTEGSETGSNTTPPAGNGESNSTTDDSAQGGSSADETSTDTGNTADGTSTGDDHNTGSQTDDGSANDGAPNDQVNDGTNDSTVQNDDGTSVSDDNDADSDVPATSDGIDDSGNTDSHADNDAPANNTVDNSTESENQSTDDTGSDGVTYNEDTYANEGSNRPLTIDEEMERRKAENGGQTEKVESVTKPRYMPSRANELTSKQAKYLVGKDTLGNNITSDNFEIESIKVKVVRQHDGYGDKFDSVRTIESITLKNGQILKPSFQDMVGANAQSEAFATSHEGMTLPDGVYYLSAGSKKDDWSKNSDGTYDSPSYHNTLKLNTNDENIPESIRNKINNGCYLMHANKFKHSLKESDTPFSAGCISSALGGQKVHDRFMDNLKGVKPWLISVEIKSLSNHPF